MNDLPLVSISCNTFNHAHYLRECFEGFLMQLTNFKYEVLIHDDASTDGTKEIIEEYTKKYPDIFFPMYQLENQYSKGVRGIMAKFNFPRCRGNYIALCEGDDYWTDPYKLQKQVDFLEANQDYAICWTKYMVKNGAAFYNEFDLPSWAVPIGHKKDITFDLNTIFTPYCTYTLTSMFRKKAFDFKLFESLCFAKDNTLYAICLNRGKGILLNFYGAVYRKHSSSIYSGASRLRQNIDSYRNMKEIIEKVPNCNNDNFRGIRNFHLVESLKLSKTITDKVYLELLFDCYKFLGLKSTMSLLKQSFSLSSNNTKL